ncbi:dihydrolipoamide acetyltransferase family protein [Pseudohaliea sp.]|uniref:dihydrolipoamide acetyltransferase family protein n=1 Tax=Pseudohaliea sp. TaxID=2740289 RepID=UPI0032EB6F8D
MGRHLITMPDVGEGIAEVEITEWQVSEGQEVTEDDVLCVVMTDKAAVEIPSPVDGTVAWLGAPAGTVMAVGAELVALEVEGPGNVSETGGATAQSTRASSSDEPENRPSAPVDTDRAEAATTATAPSTSPQSSFPDTTTHAPGGNRARPLASPAVRWRAREADVDLRELTGTGPAGRITHEDLDSHLEHGSTRQAAGRRMPDKRIDEVPVTGLRAEIARRMQSTMQRIPHYSYVEAVDVTELQRLRQRMNDRTGEGEPRLTLLPFLIRGLVRAIEAYPAINARYDDEHNLVQRHGALHAGIATQTDRGLVVTVLRHAEALSLREMASELRRLAEAARAGRATREELTGSTLTLSSLGPYGGIATTPVINAPEVAIIGINKVETRPVWNGQQFAPREMMNLSSSFDHRIIDGWEATQFIHHLKGLLENPAELFLEE